MSTVQITWQRGHVTAVDTAADSIAKITIVADTPVRPEPGSHVDVRLPSGTCARTPWSVVAPTGTASPSVSTCPLLRAAAPHTCIRYAPTTYSTSPPHCRTSRCVGAPSYVLLAGGIGITAVSAMGAVLRRMGSAYRFVYVGRTRSAMAFLPELEKLHGDCLEVHIDDEGTGLDVTTLVDGVDARTELYMCGPIRLMDAVRRSWTDRALPTPNLRYETFGNSGWFDAEEFVVTVPGLGLTTTVGTGESMLDALERAGVDMMFDCRKGECGLCQVGIASVDGRVDHRDVFFSEAQKTDSTKICACVSRVAPCPSESGARSAPGVITLDIP